MRRVVVALFAAFMWLAACDDAGPIPPPDEWECGYAEIDTLTSERTVVRLPCAEKPWR